MINCTFIDKKTLDRIKRQDTEEENMSDLEDKAIESVYTKEQKVRDQNISKFSMIFNIKSYKTILGVLKEWRKNRHWWLTPVLLATQ
jgi:hypothetical protein